MGKKLKRFNLIYKRYKVYMLFAFGLLFATIIIGLRILFIPVIGHDDGITLLSATCHQGMYHTSLPSGVWVNAEILQSYWSLSDEKIFCFRTISRDLASRDIHPPLYFWSLHVWLHIFGSGIVSATSLNIVYMLLTAITIFLICKALNISRFVSVIVALLWLMSPSTLEVSNIIRQYALFGLMTSVSFLFAVLYYKHSKNKYIFYYTFAVTAGLLTHYQFFPVAILPLLLGVSISLMKNGRWQHLRSLVLSTSLSIILLVIIHPFFFSAVSRQQAQRQTFEASDIFVRLSRSMVELQQLFFPNRIIPEMRFFLDRPALVMSILTFSIVFYFLIYFRRGLKGFFLSALYKPDEQIFSLLVSFSGLIIIIILYISQLAPKHAMGAQYIIAITPIIFVVIGQIINNLREGKSFLIVILLIFQFFFGSISSVSYIENSRNITDASFFLDEDTTVLIDTTARGVLPRIMWHMDQSITVYVANQSEILENFSLNDEETGEILYISNLDYGNSISGRISIQLLLENYGYQYRGQVGEIFGVADVMLFTRVDN